MRIRFAGILSVVVLEAAISLWVQASDSTGKPTDAPLLHTAVTGRISATGLNDPQYLLSFPSVQRAMLRATEHCLKQSEIEKELMGTPGQFYRAKFTSEAVGKAVDEFQNAIRLDPNFAEAYAEKGMAYWLLSQPLGDISAKEGMPKAKEAASKALEIDNNLALAHTVLGWTASFYDWDWSKAEQEFRQAIRLNSNDAWAHLGYAFLLSSLGQRERGIEEAKRAVQVAPLDLSIRSGLSEQYLLAHQFDAAVKECEEAIKVDPAFGRSYWDLSRIYESAGDYDQAIAASEKDMLLAGASRDKVAELSRTYRRGGINAVRQWELKTAKGWESANPFWGAAKYAALGEHDKAIEYLQKAYEDRAGSMLFLNVDPSFDKMHLDPRFQEIVRRVGLPQ